MDNKKSFDEKLQDMKNRPGDSLLDLDLVSEESLEQMIKGHQLKYIENVLEVEEENKLIDVNVKDFLAYPEEIQQAAVDIYDQAVADPNYFEKPESNKELIKPVMILANIDNKKNESKIKNWKVEYHARLIERLKAFNGKKFEQSPSIKGFLSKIFN